MNYTDILRELLQQQYPEAQDTKTIVISSILLRLIPAPSKPLFLSYLQLQNLIITKCDLRNLENFPKIKSLRNLDISDNSLQGSLNNLMPLANLSYLNLANNFINDYRKLQPLQMIDSLEVYLAGNPFIDAEVWKSKVKNYGIKVLKEPKVFIEAKREVKQEEKKEEKKIVNSPKIKEMPNNQSNGDSLLQRRNSFLFEIRNRRRRLEQQQRNENRRGVLDLESESNSIIRAVGPNQNIMEIPLPQYSSSEEDQDEEVQEQQNHKQYASEEIEPFFDVFINEDLEVEEDEEEENEQIEPSEESQS